MVKPKPLAPRWMMMGGLSCNTSGLSSRLGEVSRELVLEPPGEPSTLPPMCRLLPDEEKSAPPAAAAATAAALRSSEGMMSESPEAEADLMTERERSLTGGEGVGTGGVAAILAGTGLGGVAALSDLGGVQGATAAAALAPSLPPTAEFLLVLAPLGCWGRR